MIVLYRIDAYWAHYITIYNSQKTMEDLFLTRPLFNEKCSIRTSFKRDLFSTYPVSNTIQSPLGRHSEKSLGAMNLMRLTRGTQYLSLNSTFEADSRFAKLRFIVVHNSFNKAPRTLRLLSSRSLRFHWKSKTKSEWPEKNKLNNKTNFATYSLNCEIFLSNT